MLDPDLQHMCWRCPGGLFMATVMSHPLPPVLSPSLIPLTRKVSCLARGQIALYAEFLWGVPVVILVRNSFMCDWEFLTDLRARWGSDCLIGESFAAPSSHWERQTGMSVSKVFTLGTCQAAFDRETDVIHSLTDTKDVLSRNILTVYD